MDKKPGNIVSTLDMQRLDTLMSRSRTATFQARRTCAPSSIARKPSSRSTCRRR